MKKIINFVNRTKQSILNAMYKLRMRYKRVRFEYKLEKGLFNGFFTVEGILWKKKYTY